MNRVQLFRLPLILLCCFLPAACVTPAGAQESVFLDEELTPELAEQFEMQLNAVLKTRTDQEKAFITQLVANTQQGAVPIKLITTSFRWVQESRPNSNYPFIYFERVLRLQADKIGVADAIPPFDFDLFRSAGQQEPGQQLNAGRLTDQQRQSLLETARSRFSGVFRRVPGIASLINDDPIEQ